jgi:hypothetical protein
MLGALLAVSGREPWRLVGAAPARCLLHSHPGGLVTRLQRSRGCGCDVACCHRKRFTLLLAALRAAHSRRHPQLQAAAAAAAARGGPRRRAKVHAVEAGADADVEGLVGGGQARQGRLHRRQRSKAAESRAGCCSASSGTDVAAAGLW